MDKNTVKGTFSLFLGKYKSRQATATGAKIYRLQLIP